MPKGHIGLRFVDGEWFAMNEGLVHTSDNTSADVGGNENVVYSTPDNFSDFANEAMDTLNERNTQCRNTFKDEGELTQQLRFRESCFDDSPIPETDAGR